MSIWSSVLDSCPGLLCCVINLKGKLLYASHGYKTVASRLFGHTCNEGSSYPPLINDFDKMLHEILTAACLGKPNAIEVPERDKIWEVTASPLRLDSRRIEGVVVKLSYENINPANSKPPAPIIQSNPEILESVPFRACVVNSVGLILAVNKFLAESCEFELVGRNIVELVKLDSNASVMNIISSRSGKVECRMPGIAVNKSFYDGDVKFYFDDKFSDSDEVNEAQHEDAVINIHASPIKWHDTESVMLTLENVTELTQAHSQLRRLLTFDASTGILNRRGIEHVLAREFAPAVRTSDQLSIIMLSIDNLKALNETRGYAAGTRIIRGFVNIMDKFLSSHARHYIARWSGDEFMILVHCSGAAAVVLANEIKERSVSLSLSAGVAELNKGGYAGVNDFVAAAYDAMLSAKLAGKNSTVLANNS